MTPRRQAINVWLLIATGLDSEQHVKTIQLGCGPAELFMSTNSLAELRCSCGAGNRCIANQFNLPVIGHDGSLALAGGLAN